MTPTLTAWLLSTAAIDAMSQIKPAKVSSAAQSQFLTEAEKKAQAGRCSCRGSAARAAKEQS